MQINKIKSFAIHTLGCKVNTYESNIIRNELLSYGMIECDFKQKVDLYIINTCSVTNNADLKSRNIIARAKKLNPEAIVFVCGCYSQVAKEIKNADIVIGNKYKNGIINVLEEYLTNHQNKLIKVDNLLLETEFEDTKIDDFKQNTRAFLKIQDGCNFMCSYCIIPFTRGRQRSKDANKIIDEIKTLVANGYKEIVLTGVNTAGYHDLNNEINFYQLLKMINKLPGEFRVRISSVEPFQIDHDIIDLIVNNKRFAQHWHICLQSGSDSVLNQMHRKYSTKEFLKLVNYIYSKNPYTAITTDYICGFPTETDEDHQLSIKFCKQVGFYQMHIFPYSKRKFTPAANLVQVKDEIKKQRVDDFLKLNKELENNFLSKFVNKEVVVLIEKAIDTNKYIGKTSEYLDVIINSDTDITNQLVNVKITKKVFNNLIGEIIK